MAKFEKQLFNKQNIFGMTLLRAYAQYIYIVNAKYEKPSVKALVQVGLSVYAQAKSLFQSNQEKLAHFTNLLFCPKKKRIELFRHKLWYKLNSLHMHYHTKLLS